MVNLLYCLLHFTFEGLEQFIHFLLSEKEETTPYCQQVSSVYTDHRNNTPEIRDVEVQLAQTRSWENGVAMHGQCNSAQYLER